MSIRLSFGTAGIRAALGPGDDQINVRTVRAVAHALVRYLDETLASARERGLCVGFDGRTDSDTFAREVAAVALAHGFRVRTFEEPAPTPLLAFATRLHDAAAGVMITASHNPPHENGLKIYMERGAQVLAPHDRELAARIAQYDERDDVAGGVMGASEPLGDAEVGAYLDAVEALVARTTSPLPRVAYSALCGVGSALTHRVLERAATHEVSEVLAQAKPRSDFGGLSTPNPEHLVALEQLRAHAEAENIDLAFAHDPDADRLAVMVRDAHGTLRALSGDEVGALLGGFLLEAASEPSQTLLVSTLVSGDLLERIAHAAGARFERTPTGFKWIAARARALERESGLRFLFGYEEAIGYAFGAMADDKDGVAALYVLLELARRLHAQGRTLLDRLDELSMRFGVHASRQLTLPRGSGEGPDLLARLRASDPTSLLGASARATDYRREPESVDLWIVRAEGHKLCARPSGTEPKLKLYLHAHAPVLEGDLAAARGRATAQLDAMERALRTL